MFSKIIFVLLGATLVLADLESDYIEISRQEDARAVKEYFTTQEPLPLRLQWDRFLGRALLIIENGKQKALEKASISQIEEVKRQWNAVQEQGINGQYEVKQIIDSLRSQALVYAPQEWNQVIQMSIELVEGYKKTAAEGDANGTKQVLDTCRRNFRQIQINLRKIIATRSRQAQG